MMIRRNLIESVTLFSCSGAIICVLLNYLTNISPLTGVWFTIYVIVLFIVSVLFSFRIIQWFLRLNKPLKFDLDDLASYYRGLSRFRPPPLERKGAQTHVYDTNELSVISTVLERKLVSSWYVHNVSQEISFPFACKQLLDQMIGKAFHICNQIEPKDVFIDTCTILTSHLKEYKKALKRHEKCPITTVESHYKKTHLIFNNTDIQSADHCTNILRIVLKELVPWEFWDTPHSELLVRILSKKLDYFVDTTLSDPVWINDKLLTILRNEESHTGKAEQNTRVEKDIVKEKPSVEINQEAEMPKEIDLAKPETTTIESALTTLITKSTAPILQRDITEDISSSQTENNVNGIEEVVGKASEPVDIKASPILRQRRGRQGRNEVKIYDRIIEGSVKTWENDIDLQCISLGQDLLASLNGEITLSRLWGQEGDPDSGKSDQALWFGDDDALDMELETPKDSSQLSPVQKENHTTSPTKKEHQHSPNPTDALLKDLQTTVHQAKSKIGDLQVEIVDVPRANDDEAAGMMEGLLDFGIAGLRKGLRFTGLSDEAQDKSPSHHQRDKEKMENTSPPADVKDRPIEKLPTDCAQPTEVITSTVIQKEENGLNSGPHLVKQQRVASQDSLPLLAKPLVLGELPPSLPPLCDSPEPEYEEAADLSTSIAKLRCLLQQRELSPNRSEEGIWWEGAEETRGRTHHHYSSRPVDTATLADEYDTNAERNSSPGQTSNNMQRLDRLLQRTVTGVFNSIKTAVGAEEQPGAPPLRDWTYVCTSVEMSVCGAVARLVGSRRAVSRVDAALDSLDHLPPPPTQAKELVPDDFEEWCAMRGACWCACAELAAAAGLLHSHVAYRMGTLLFAELAESLITAWLAELTDWLKKTIFRIFEEMADEQMNTAVSKQELREFNVEHTCDIIVGRLEGLSQISGQAWHGRAWRKFSARSPGKTFKKYIASSEKTKERRKYYSRRRLFPSKAKPAQSDKSYGPEAQDTVDPVNLDDLKKMCADKLPEFDKTLEEIQAIEESTIGQHENDLYNIHRSDRLTASQFGLIGKRRKSTPSHNHVKQVLYKSNVLTNDMLYGQQNESVARTYFIENYKKRVRQAGLFIDAEFGFLGASPDALQFFGEETVSDSVTLCVSSLTYKEVNKDVIFRVLDLFALHFKNSASVLSPSFDTN